MKLFYWINGVVLAFLVLAWAVETAIPSAPQIISDKTILALIAGSTAQVGALALFVGRAMVSRRRPPDGNDDSAG